MGIRLGQCAPDFEQDTANGSVRFHEWLGASWGVLFCHPRNFTPVFATDIVAAARLGAEWARRGVKVICLSVDTAECHIDWIAEVEATQACRIDFPMIADCDRSVAALYGMVDPGRDPSSTVRGVFVIDPLKRIRLMRPYPDSTGCNFAEILGLIDSLQSADVAQSRADR